MTFSAEQFPLKDLSLFGETNNQDDKIFRWPTADDIRNMNLSEPPKLKEILVKGTNSHGLSYMQLKFENGIESPIFDANRDDAGAIKSYKIKSSSRISQMSARVNLRNNLNQLHLSYADGVKDDIIIFHSNGDDKTKAVPAGHIVVGMYGKSTSPNGSRICALGWILMDISNYKK